MLSKLPIGKDTPNDVNVIVENPIGEKPVKYELDKETGLMFVDRFLHTAMVYPSNYGFIPHTLSGDGDPTDCMVIGNTPVMPGAVINARPVGVLLMEDDGGMDEKILAVPSHHVHPYYDNIQTVDDLPEIKRDQIKHFFEHYKDLEKGKWAKTVRWGDVEEAKRLILEGIERAKLDQTA